ncbi:AB hydrolase superfamily protein YdjP [Cytospora mali]|uniref:AB hydrolase superfamily protein YdjP n=1 Tax=Cytospora mali TaxID=578113 RepID=A0A194VWZ0_CYTMA|nr:AB hydrolase superfamily protein YdjP [Valsa mali]
MKLPSEPGMQYVYCDTNDGISLAFQSSLPLEDIPGSGSGSPADPRRQTCILLMHGFSGSSAYFTRNFADLSENHWVVAPDMRGHGASGRSKGGYHVARLAADLRTIIKFLREHQSNVKIVPVGCSIGAAVLWTYVELFGDVDFAGFVFADQAPLQDRSPFDKWDASKSHLGCYNEATMFTAQRAWTETPHEAHKGLVGECLGYRYAPESNDNVSPEQAAKDEEFFTSISQLCDGVWLARLLADHTRYDHREAIEGITKPTLVLAGRRTGCFPLEGMKETAMRVKKGSGRPGLARWSVFDGGHWMFYEEPERFNKELTDFVADCIATGQEHNILDLPPDLPAWRERLFHLREPITMAEDDFDLYWGYISNAWVPNGSVRPLQNGDQSRWYQCLLHTTRSKQLAKGENGPANRQRARTSREETFCEAAIKVTHSTDGTVKLMRSNDSDHDHDLDRIDKIRRNPALKRAAAAEVTAGNKPAEVFANLNAFREQLVAAGGQWLTRQDIINASRR